MKEKIVIPKDKIKVLTSCGHFPANGYFTFYKEDAEVKQVPKTWEDLQELCRALALIVRKKTIEFWGETIGTNMIFCKNGDIFLNTDEFFATERTPAQMWDIIQSLFFKEEEK